MSKILFKSLRTFQIFGYLPPEFFASLEAYREVPGTITWLDDFMPLPSVELLLEGVLKEWIWRPVALVDRLCSWFQFNFMLQQIRAAEIPVEGPDVKVVEHELSLIHI